MDNSCYILPVSKAFTKEDDVAVAEIVRRPVATEPIHLTRAGIERLQEELRTLEKQRGRGAIDDRERQIQELRQKLALAVAVEPVRGDDEVVRFGAAVLVRSHNDGDESEYRIVGPAEADPAKGSISSHSPLAKALLNRRVGERVAFKYPAGEDVLEILTVSY